MAMKQRSFNDTTPTCEQERGATGQLLRHEDVCGTGKTA
ncbi:hypothetical protein E1A91_D06G144500v1 [Gossypium mustelinum]|uniref:Uncharacterized protein n=1 Tax=Gossypium mustelinum TaxID=34275 RepID=A0A5D2UIY2_GOSMU|nr:hypothetical protein E1A91_D06G144500v1 [Gossypium mustelinum]